MLTADINPSFETKKEKKIKYSKSIEKSNLS